ncbi:hypothetical protein VMCG_00260 [Cytospora schulzeri]|uniref:Enoyl reductase (ER) domain-containing protein n=1 Tax=Cytospora schulzeri TaxID=448051 RepID=A0A423X980_9PEZI|nr:hypothetical protein VMCG_00260 [Valsa malicola]
MKAVVFDGPHMVSIQDRPVPKLQNSTDIIVKVHATALCGSELHVFRGLEPSSTGFIMGHEFTGTVVEAGGEVKTVKPGDKIVSPFTITCGQCYYCKSGYSSRCVESLCFGSPKLDGGQAEYVRIPHADGTVLKAPTEVDDQCLVLMADIFPTGYFGAKNAFTSLSPTERAEATVVVPKHLFAVDSVDSRLEEARKLGAEPLNFVKDKEGMFQRVKAVTEGRGADAVIEVVGLSPALRTAFDLIRPWGVISSIGVHNAEIPWTGEEAYNKNIRLQMGRCPVRSLFPEALVLLAKSQDKLSFMFDKIMPLEDAVEGYELFDKMKVQKVIFKT